MKKLLFILLISSVSFSQTIDLGVGVSHIKQYEPIEYSALIASRNIYKDFGAFVTLKGGLELSNVTLGVNYNVWDNLTASFGVGSQKQISEINSNYSILKYKKVVCFEISTDYHFKLSNKSAIGLQIGYNSGNYGFNQKNGDYFSNIYYSFDLGKK